MHSLHLSSARTNPGRPPGTWLAAVLLLATQAAWAGVYTINPRFTAELDISIVGQAPVTTKAGPAAAGTEVASTVPTANGTAEWSASALTQAGPNLEVGTKITGKNYAHGFANAISTLRIDVVNDGMGSAIADFDYHIDAGQILFTVQDPHKTVQDEMLGSLHAELVVFREDGSMDTLFKYVLAIASLDDKGGWYFDLAASTPEGLGLVDDALIGGSTFGVTTKAVDDSVSFGLAFGETATLEYQMWAVGELPLPFVDWSRTFDVRLGDPFSVGGGSTLTLRNPDVNAVPAPGSAALLALGLLALGLPAARRRLGAAPDGGGVDGHGRAADDPGHALPPAPRVRRFTPGR